ncbi:MAG: sigma-54 interaction domain-containing protein [Methylococcaceae bacterium]
MLSTLFERLVGCSPAMRQVHQMIECLARTDTTALIYGETGTGKELVAEAVHTLSARASAPLIRVNCAALSEHLLESELFGHVKGAFTSAISNRIGCFEAANGGTLFLDEIGDISPATQVRLLRVLEEKTLQRVGCNITRPLNLRVITATNKNLSAEVAAGRFRADLFYRLNTVTLTLPPLRQRHADIPVLTEFFIKFFNESFTRKIAGITPGAMAELVARPWPGNVRELRNVIEHAFVYCNSSMIDVKDLGESEVCLPWPFREDLRKSDRRSSSRRNGNGNVITETPSQSSSLDVDTLRNALERCHWHIGRTAAALNMHRTTLWRYMQRFELTSRN